MNSDMQNLIARIKADMLEAVPKAVRETRFDAAKVAAVVALGALASGCATTAQPGAAPATAQPQSKPAELVQRIQNFAGGGFKLDPNFMKPKVTRSGIFAEKASSEAADARAKPQAMLSSRALSWPGAHEAVTAARGSGVDPALIMAVHTAQSGSRSPDSMSAIAQKLNQRLAQCNGQTACALATYRKDSASSPVESDDLAFASRVVGVYERFSSRPETVRLARQQLNDMHDTMKVAHEEPHSPGFGMRM